MPSGFDLVGVLTFGNKLAHFGGAHQQVEEIALQVELLAVLGEIAIGIDDIFKIDALGNYGLWVKVVQIHAMAQFIHLWRGFGTEAARGRELKGIASHVGVAIDLEWPVGAAAQAYSRALEVAHRGIEVDGKHIRQIGARSDRQGIAGLVGVVLAGNDREVTLLAVLEPALTVRHLRQFTQRHAVDCGDRQSAHARLKRHIKYGAVNIHAVRVGTIQHHELLIIGHCSIHQIDHRHVVGVEPEAHILDIGYNDIDAVHHLLTGHGRLAVVEGSDGDACFLVNTA